MVKTDPSLLNAVLLLEPDNFTNQMWGGDWIPRFKGLAPARGPVGESWEFSVRPERPTSVRLSNGDRVPLPVLFREHPVEMLGPRFAQRFDGVAPLLIKFIDAQDDLSLQVHPSDTDLGPDAKDGGKSESWTILETGAEDGDGFIYLGFDAERAAGYAGPDDFETAFFDALNQANALGPSRDPAVRAKAARLVLPFLNKVRVRPGEVYDIRPGVIHATGRGVRLFEIQQSSDLTYRVWDWNRPDAEKLKEGKTVFRDLHLKEARAVMDFRAAPPLVRMPGRANGREEELVMEQEKKFAAKRICFEDTRTEATLSTGGQFQVLTALQGEVVMKATTEVRLTRGRSALVPACVGKFSIKAASAPSEVVRSYVPI